MTLRNEDNERFEAEELEDRIAPASAKAAFGLETAGGHVPAHVTLPTADEDDGGDDGDDDGDSDQP